MADNRTSLISCYFQHGLKYKEIIHVLANQHGIVISLRQLKRELQMLGLSRRTYSSIVDVIDFIQGELRTAGQLLGYRMMTAKCQQNGYNVRVNDVRLILKQLDPVGVELRLTRRLRRRAYYANGPNFIWHMDGYDKLKPYGLCINGCICGFSRKIIWLKVYHTNSNPKVIGGYFMEAVKEYGGCPRTVRADYGTENGYVRDFQCFLRRNDPEAASAYIDGASTANQRIESWWGYLRRENIHFWIELFKKLQEDGDFSGDYIDKNLVLFCFLALLQIMDNINRNCERLNHIGYEMTGLLAMITVSGITQDKMKVLNDLNEEIKKTTTDIVSQSQVMQSSIKCYKTDLARSKSAICKSEASCKSLKRKLDESEEALKKLKTDNDTSMMSLLFDDSLEDEVDKRALCKSEASCKSLKRKVDESEEALKKLKTDNDTSMSLLFDDSLEDEVDKRQDSPQLEIPETQLQPRQSST